MNERTPLRAPGPDGPTNDEIFDAMLSVALRESAEDETDARASSPPSGAAVDGPRPQRMPWLVVAAGLMVCAGVWWSLQRGATTPADRATDAIPAADVEADLAGDQDPVDAAASIRRLADPATRAAAIAALVRAGDAGAEAVIAALRTEPTQTESGASHPLFEGLLEAACRFGPRSVRFVEPIADRAADLHVEQVVRSVAVSVRAALFADVDDPLKSISVPRVKAFGRTWQGLGVEGADRCMELGARQREHVEARRGADQGQLADLLTGPEVGVRLSALELMAWAEPAAWSEGWTLAVEGALFTDHPKVERMRWRDAQQVVGTMVDYTDTIHALAAALLLRFEGEPRSAMGLIWQLDNGDVRERRAAAMGLGTALAGHEPGPRVRAAVTALMAAAEGDDPALAGDAVTSLGMLEGAAHAAVPVLARLARHEDRGLAARAQAARQRIERAGADGARVGTAQSAAALVEALAVPEERADAIARLVALGEAGAAAVARGLATEPILSPRFDGLLVAARAFGPRTETFLEPIAARASAMTASQAVAAYGVYARASIWNEVDNPHDISGVETLEAFGQSWMGIGIDLANRVQRYHVEFLGGKAVRAALAEGEASIAEPLAHAAAFLREAALERLRWEPVWDPSWTGPLAEMLVREQPPLILNQWKDGVTLEDVRLDVTAQLRRAAARLLVDRAPADPRCALGHAWIVEHGTGDLRRRSAMALGPLLAQAEARAALGDGAEFAVAALIAAAGAEDLTVAREAVTSLGMLETAAASAATVLERLTGHADAGLAARAREALRRVAGG